MTGIGGIVALDGRPCGAADLRGALDILAPLGPDGEGVWAGPVGPMGIALGAARRRRVPEDDADTQPVVVADGGVVVVADVVLTNRPGLCRTLGLPDTAELTDPAIVAHAYLRWGQDCCQRLRGEFAVAVADRRRGGLLLARDHLGLRPLHLHRAPGRVGFASTALAVTCLDGVPAAPDLERAKEFLALITVTERSWVRDVTPVPRATALWVTPDGVRQHRFWELDTSPRRDGTPADHAAELRDALSRAVHARLRRRRGAVGVMLSGGLDSTAVAATAAEQLAPEPVHTYTSAPPPGWTGPATRKDPDETRLVRALAARHPNLAPAFIHAVGAHVIDGDPDRYAAGATPIRNTINMTWIRAIHQHAAADRVSVLLSGASGNLTFSLDGPGWLVELLAAGRPVEAWRDARAWAAANQTSLADTLRHSVLGPLAPTWAHRRRAAHIGRTAPESWLAATALRPELAADPQLRRMLHPHTDRIEARGAWSLRRHPATFLDIRSAQAESAAVGEARWGWCHVDPTADLDLVELCARQPAWARRHRGLDRAAARTAMAGAVPDEIRLRRVRGAQLPDWLDRLTDAYTEVAAELAAAHTHPASRTLIDLPRLDALLQNWPAPERAADPDCARDYCLALPRALAVSRYLRWFDEWAAQDRPRHAEAAASR